MDPTYNIPFMSSRSSPFQDPWAERVQPAMKAAVLRSLEAVGVLDLKTRVPPTQGYIISHDRSDGTGIFTDPWMVDVYGKLM